MRGRLAVVVLAALGGCSPAPRTGLRVAPLQLAASDSAVHDVLPPASGESSLTVLVFSAWHCPCQAVHDARLNELFVRYHARGVDFFAVDSEIGGSPAADAVEAKKRGYAFPVLFDSGAGLAHALRAEYATETFILDRQGIVRYHGGLDSDRVALHDDAAPHLKNALDDLLGGAAPRSAETQALGCALQTW